MKDNNYENIIRENLKVIDVYEGFFNEAKECRESYYYLRSLKNIFSIHLCREVDYDKKVIDELNKRIEQAELAFNAIEEIAAINEVSIKDELMPMFTKTIKLPQMIEMIKENLDLKSKLDKLQIDILNYLINIDNKIIDELTNNKTYLSDYYIQYKFNLLTNIAFIHSTDEDKIITNKIHCNSKNIENRLKDAGIKLPVYEKIRDYSFELTRKRNEYKLCRETLLKLLEMEPKLEEEIYFKELNKKQFSYNRQITILTYIVTVFTIITLIFGGIQTYYLIIDHIKLQNSKLNKTSNGKSNIQNINKNKIDYFNLSNPIQK